MKQTALMVHIEWLENNIKHYDEQSKNFPDGCLKTCMICASTAVSIALAHAKSLLPTEREQIDRAYDRNIKLENGNVEYFRKPDTEATDYYKQNYSHKNTEQ